MPYCTCTSSQIPWGESIMLLITKSSNKGSEDTESTNSPYDDYDLTSHRSTTKPIGHQKLSNGNGDSYCLLLLESVMCEAENDNSFRL